MAKKTTAKKTARAKKKPAKGRTVAEATESQVDDAAVASAVGNQAPEEIDVLTPPDTVFDEDVQGGLRETVPGALEQYEEKEKVKCRYCGRPVPKPEGTFYKCDNDDCPGTGDPLK